MAKNYVLDFIQYYTTDFFYKDGQINYFGLLLVIIIIGYIYYRIKSGKEQATGQRIINEA